jgi:hypothetical protein
MPSASDNVFRQEEDHDRIWRPSEQKMNTTKDHIVCVYILHWLTTVKDLQQKTCT